MRRRGMVGLLVAPEVFGLDMFEVCCEVLDLVFFKRGAFPRLPLCCVQNYSPLGSVGG